MQSDLLSLSAVALLAILQLGVPRLRWSSLTQDGAALSAASGMATAYVFVLLFPELAEFQRQFLRDHPHRHFLWLHEQVFFLTLAGLVILLGLQRAAHQRELRRPGGKASFSLALAPLAAINAFVGYTLAERGGSRPLDLLLATLAYGAHLWGADVQLSRQQKEDFARTGRWVLVAALCLGWLLRAATHSHGHLVALAYAMLSGNIMADALPHEVPGEPQTRYGAFVLGTLALTCLVFLTDWLG